MNKKLDRKFVKLSKPCLEPEPGQKSVTPAPAKKARLRLCIPAGYAAPSPDIAFWEEFSGREGPSSRKFLPEGHVGIILCISNLTNQAVPLHTTDLKKCWVMGEVDTRDAEPAKN